MRIVEILVAKGADTKEAIKSVKDNLEKQKGTEYYKQWQEFTKKILKALKAK